MLNSDQLWAFGAVLLAWTIHLAGFILWLQGRFDLILKVIRDHELADERRFGEIEGDMKVLLPRKHHG